MFMRGRDGRKGEIQELPSERLAPILQRDI